MLGMKRILFVDDDPPVLEGLRLRLRPFETAWDMTFAGTGGQALAEFQREPYDVIVSDIRMPGVQGARLLRTVSERWPEAVRIALSGVTNPQETLHLVPIAHQFLSKPCEPSLLEATIEHCLKVSELLPERRLRALVGRVRRLFPQRRAYTNLQSLLSDDQATVHQVAELIASDTVMAAKILQMVHSAFFRRARRIASIEQAVAYLGLDAVRSVVLSAEVFSQWPDKPVASSLDLDRLQRHASAVANVAHALTAEAPVADDARLAGLLHDIGYWVLAHESPREIERAHACALQKGIPIYEAERETIGASHAEIGAYLLGIWGLPYSVAEAVAHHHAPEGVRQAGLDALSALVIAHALEGAGDSVAFRSTLQSDSRVGAEYLESLSTSLSWDEAIRRASAANNCGARNA